MILPPGLYAGNCVWPQPGVKTVWCSGAGNLDAGQVVFVSRWTVPRRVHPPDVERQGLVKGANWTIPFVDVHHRQSPEGKVDGQDPLARVLPRDCGVLDSPGKSWSTSVLVHAENHDLLGCQDVAVSRGIVDTVGQDLPKRPDPVGSVLLWEALRIASPLAAALAVAPDNDSPPFLFQPIIRVPVRPLTVSEEDGLIWGKGPGITSRVLGLDA